VQHTMTEYTVVVADDDAQVALAIAKLVEPGGHTVVGTASTGEEAVWLNQVHQPDVVILDLEMPGINGVATGADCGLHGPF
jgi:CheY-like chemotaxis protein